MSLPLDYRASAFLLQKNDPISAFGRVITFSRSNTTNKQLSLVINFSFFLFFSHCKLLCYVHIMKVLFFNASWYILTFLNFDLLAFLTSICFWDVKINIITRVNNVTIVSRFYPRLVFSYAFFFVKIIHLLNAKPCFQIFFICLCPAIMGFDDRKGIYVSDDSVLLLITYLGHPVLTYQ